MKKYTDYRTMFLASAVLSIASFTAPVQSLAATAAPSDMTLEATDIYQHAVTITPSTDFEVKSVVADSAWIRVEYTEGDSSFTYTLDPNIEGLRNGVITITTEKPSLEGEPEVETCTVLVGQLPAEQVFAYRETATPGEVEIIGFRWAGEAGTLAQANIPTHIGYQDTEKVVTWVDSNTFALEKDKLQSVSYPNTVTAIASGTFEDCAVLEEVNLPSIVTIEAKSFTGCPELKKVTMPAVTDIGESAFEGCAKLTDVYMEAMQNIGVAAFKNCASLETLGQTEHLVNIGNNAFEACTSLPYFDLSATTFGEYVFKGCTSLQSVKLNPEITQINKGTFYGCSSLGTLKYTDVVPEDDILGLPESVVTVCEDAFYGCSSLTEVAMPGVITIEKSAFQNCTSLVNFSIPKAITIGESAFQGCTSLVGGSLKYGYETVEALSLPFGLETIGANAFYGCTSLVTVSIGNYEGYTTGFTTDTNSITALKSIGDQAFAKCPSLKSIYFYGFQPKADGAVFGARADDTDTRDVISYFLLSKSSYTWCEPPYHRNSDGDFVTTTTPVTGLRKGAGNSDIMTDQETWRYDEKAVVVYADRPTKMWRIPQIITSTLPATIVNTQKIAEISDYITSNSGLPVELSSSDKSIVAVKNIVADEANAKNTGYVEGKGYGKATIHTYQEGLNYDADTDKRWTVISDFAPFSSSEGQGDIIIEGVKAPIVITANSASKIYGETVDTTALTFSAISVVGGVTTDYTADITVEFASEGIDATADIGEYSLTIASYSSETLTLKDFEISTVPATLTVGKAALEIIATSQTQVEGETPIKEFTTNPATLPNEDKVGCVMTFDAATGVLSFNEDETVIMRGEKDVKRNYDITYTPGTITFEPLATTIIVTPVSPDLPDQITKEIITLPYADKDSEGAEIVVTRTINVDANGIWYATADVDWLTLDPVKGPAGINAVNFTATINVDQIRDGVISINNGKAGEGLVEVLLTVVQSAKSVDSEWEWVVVDPATGTITDDSFTTSAGYQPADASARGLLAKEFTSTNNIGDRLPIASITKYNGTNTSVVVPTILNGVIVAAFADAQDADHGTFTESEVTSVSFDNVLKLIAIGDYTFSGSKIESTFEVDLVPAEDTIAKFVVPSTIGYIGDSAFEDCAALKNVTFEDALYFFDADDAGAAEPDLPDGRAKKVAGYADNYNAFAVDTYVNGRYADGRRAPVLVSIGDRAFAGSGLNANGTPNNQESNYLLIPREVQDIGVNAFECADLDEIYFLGAAPYTPGTPMGSYTDALPCFEPASFGTARPTINYLPYYSVWRRDNDGFAWFPTYTGCKYASWEQIIALNYAGTYDKVWAGFEFSTWRIGQEIEGVIIIGATPTEEGYEVLYGTTGVKAEGALGEYTELPGTDHFIYTSNNTSVATVGTTSGIITLNAIGTAVITASRADDGIYKEVRAMTTLTVNPAIVTIVPLDQNLRYPINNVATNSFKTVNTPGLSINDVFNYEYEPTTAPEITITGTTVATVATSESPVGDYAITVDAEGTIANSNYVFATEHDTALLHIYAKEDALVITALDQWKWQGQEIVLTDMTPNFTATLDGELTEAVESVTLTSDGAAAAAAAGRYAIVPSDVQPVDLTKFYVPTYVEGTLEVRDGADSLTIDPIAQPVTSAGATGLSFTVTPDSATSLWMLESAPEWVTITGAIFGDEVNAYEGTQTFTYSVEALSEDQKRSGAIVAYAYSSTGEKITASLIIRQSEGNFDFWVGYAEPDTTVAKNEIEVTKYVGDKTVVIVPEVLEDHPEHQRIGGGSGTVVGIGTTAFYNKKAITSITLPATVGYIKDWAFAYCDALVSFQTAEEVIAAEDDEDVAFDFVITGNITNVAKYAFAYNPSIKNARIDNLSILNEGLFNGCTGLENVYVKTAEIEELQKWAFFGCTSLKTIVFDGDLKVTDGKIAVDSETFKYCGTEEEPLVLVTNGSEGWQILEQKLKELDINVVVKYAQTISVDELTDLTYGDYEATDGVFSVNAVATSGLEVTLSVEPAGILEALPPAEPGAVASFKIIGTGDVTVTASQAGDDRYMPAADVAQTITIAKADLTFTPTFSGTVHYGDPIPEYRDLQIDGLCYQDEESVVEGLIVVSCDYTVGTPAGTECTISVDTTEASAANYNIIGVEKKFVVAQYATAIYWDNQAGYANIPLNSEYQPTDLLSADADAEGTITYWNEETEITGDNVFAPGEYAITAKFASEDPNYASAEKTVVFSIEQAYLDSLVPPSINVGRDGGTFTIDVKANTDWEVANDSDWITIEGITMGIGTETLTDIYSGTITYTVAPAVAEEARTGAITVYTLIAGPEAKTTEVTQSGVPFIKVVGEEPVVEYDETDTVYVEIAANFMWDLSSVNSDWMYDAQATVNADNSGYVSFKVYKNTDPENARIGSFTLISDEEGVTYEKIITVTQAAAATLAFDKEVEYADAGAGFGALTVTSNREGWEYSVDADWLTVEQDGNTLKYSYTARDSMTLEGREARSATITATLRSEVATFTLNQDAFVPYVVFSPEVSRVSAEATTIDIDVAAAFYWDEESLTIDSDWIDWENVIVELDNTGRITLNIAENTTNYIRTGTVTVSITDELTGDVLTADAIIMQDTALAHFITIEPSMPIVNAEECVVDFTVTSTFPWDPDEIELSDSWMTVEEVILGTDNCGTVKVRVANNIGGAYREGTVTVTALDEITLEDIKATATIAQYGIVQTEIEATPEVAEVSIDGGEVTFTIKANATWDWKQSLKAPADWCKPKSAQADPDGKGGKFTFKVSPNTTGEDREVVIYFYAEGLFGSAVTAVTISQTGVVPVVPTISYERNGDELIISFTGGTLYSSTDCKTWEKVTSTVGVKVVVDMTENEQMFFKVE